MVNPVLIVGLVAVPIAICTILSFTVYQALRRRKGDNAIGRPWARAKDIEMQNLPPNQRQTIAMDDNTHEGVGPAPPRMVEDAAYMMSGALPGFGNNFAGPSEERSVYEVHHHGTPYSGHDDAQGREYFGKQWKGKEKADNDIEVQDFAARERDSKGKARAKEEPDEKAVEFEDVDLERETVFVPEKKERRMTKEERREKARKEAEAKLEGTWTGE